MVASTDILCLQTYRREATSRQQLKQKGKFFGFGFFWRGGERNEVLRLQDPFCSSYFNVFTLLVKLLMAEFMKLYNFNTLKQCKY